MPMDESEVVPTPTQYRLAASTIAIRTDADTDPATAASLSLIAVVWMELGEDQEWLSAVWWC